MRDSSAAAKAATGLAQAVVLDLLEISGSFGIFRFVNFDRPVLIDGNGFEPLGFKFQPIGGPLTLERIQFDLILADMTGEFAYRLNSDLVDPSGAVIQIWQMTLAPSVITYSFSSADMILRFSGEYLEYTSGDGFVQVRAASGLARSDEELPRKTLRDTCNFSFADVLTCGVNKVRPAFGGDNEATFASGSTGHGQSDYLRDYPKSPVGFTVYFTGGTNAGQSRLINTYNPNGTITWIVTLPSSVSSGDTFYVVWDTPSPQDNQVRTEVVAPLWGGQLNTPLSFRVGALVDSPLVYADHYFRHGTVKIESGSNTGVSRIVLDSFAASPPGYLKLRVPLPAVALPGDKILLYRGCDKTSVTCGRAFNNLARFGGYNLVPRSPVRGGRFV